MGYGVYSKGGVFEHRRGCWQGPGQWVIAGTVSCMDHNTGHYPIRYLAQMSSTAPGYWGGGMRWWLAVVVVGGGGSGFSQISMGHARPHDPYVTKNPL